jgi:uncharacterized tellurite resistance protein B-like protein
MLDRILRMLEKSGGGDAKAKTPPEARFDRKEVAAAALMIESCRIDAKYSATERARITEIVQERFELDPADAKALVKFAEARQAEVYSDWLFMEAVKKGFAENERAEIIGMLWEVAFADGHLHRFEEHMIARVAGEIGVGEAEIEDERKRALARLGLKDPKA